MRHSALFEARWFPLLVGVILLGFAVVPAAAVPEAFEIGEHNVAELPGGREADGIIGDFVLRNDRVELVISGNLHQRKANMFAPVSPGCIYDFTLRGTNNDQLFWLAPGQLRGQLSAVRVIKDGTDGEAVIRAELTPAFGGGLGRTHDYVLRDGQDYVLMVSSYENRGEKPQKFRVHPEWQGLVAGFAVDGVIGAFCQDPEDRIAYAYQQIEMEGVDPPQHTLELAPGKTYRCAAVFAVGHGSANVYGTLSGRLKEVNRFRGQIADASGHPAPGAMLHIGEGERELRAFVDQEGRFDFAFPADKVQVKVKDPGRPDVDAELAGGGDNRIGIAAASGVRMVVSDEAGGPIPCKVQFIGIDPTPTPNLGPNIRAHGCDNQYHSENGRFAQPLPPGKYRLVITHGIEYDHQEREVTVSPGKVTEVEAALHRVMDTAGWISTDFHNHSTVSGDNYCGTDDRMINLAAEQVEFAPATEHNRIYDWRPHIKRLGLLPHLNTVTGMELTGGGPHLNAFPLEPKLHRQDNGAPQWDPDPRISALLLRRHPGDRANRWVQLNHPEVAVDFNDLNSDGEPDGGFTHLESFLDAAEVWGTHILLAKPRYMRKYRGQDRNVENRPFAWLQMLNAGRTLWTIAVSDAHEVTMGGVGGWRTYVRSSTDDPAKIDYREIIGNAKAGKSFVTTGPFLEVECAGHGPGETVKSDGGAVTLVVRVQCNTWTEVDRVAVMVNGRVVPELDFRRSASGGEGFLEKGAVRFQREIRVPLKRDAHLIVVATGEQSTLATGYGRSWQSEMNPIAYHNPIFVDVDGNGFQPNGDTLDSPFLSAKK